MVRIAARSSLSAPKPAAAARPLTLKPAHTPVANAITTSHTRTIPHPPFAHTGLLNTYYNLRKAGGSAVALPDCSFGPLLNFRGKLSGSKVCTGQCYVFSLAVLSRAPLAVSWRASRPGWGWLGAAPCCVACMACMHDSAQSQRGLAGSGMLWGWVAGAPLQFTHSVFCALLKLPGTAVCLHSCWGSPASLV
jgi:hypothetical protein